METAVDQAAEPCLSEHLLVVRKLEAVVDFRIFEAVCPVGLRAVAGVEKLHSDRASTYHFHFGVSQLLRDYGDMLTYQAAPESYPAS